MKLDPRTSVLCLAPSDVRLLRHRQQARKGLTELAKRWEFEALVPNNWHAFETVKAFWKSVPAAKQCTHCIIMFATQKTPGENGAVSDTCHLSTQPSLRRQSLLGTAWNSKLSNVSRLHLRRSHGRHVGTYMTRN
jgi:hypothetical protein